MDFKALGLAPPPWRVLSVIDDASRFAVCLQRVEGGTGQAVFQALLQAFGTYGLPEAILTDNEHCFHSVQSKGPSWLEARLWRLGIQTLHGRPGHPQTQGKAERFHRTLQEELGPLLRDAERVDQALEAFRLHYNWERPHAALGDKVPGSRWQPSPRSMPDTLPEPQYPDGAELRKVCSQGRFKRHGKLYQVGRGLAGEHVALVEHEDGLWACYAHVPFARLEHLLQR
jgi:hypothetical protein